MLKVGDKVKIRGDLEVGQKFNKCDFTKEMKKYRDKLAKIEFICGRFILLDIDNQEFGWTEDMFDKIEEDNNMKELTFKEVIVNIKEDEVWESNDISIFKTKDDISISWKNDDYDNGVLIFDDEKFKLTKRKEYTFEEAFKSFNIGKEIESCKSKLKYKICEDGLIRITNLTNDEKWLRGNDDNNFTVSEIQNKWYINDLLHI